ncbi:NlpC/P60 family protein [Xylocopilactobacillus apis]|uniref:NlpC/P60 domain-containing protein n=1 Tax=Xylocopilactobacillus apis TaxID=2932183 RepID=A0AAU9D4B9_9LACO|nr:C40 family peptidase [Xylocopilactobacillus apis]BDR57326.1 hypothetical protein KIMC2_18880 [Xylocopilactobacillus apis]
MQLKKIFISVIAFGTVSSLGVSPVSADTVSEKNSQIEVKKIESNSLLKQINEAQSKVAQLNNKVSDKVVAISDAKTKIKDTNTQINSLGKKISSKKVEISKRKDNLKDQVRSLQAASNNSVTGNTFLDFVLGSSSLSDLIGRSMTVNKLNSASQSTLKSVEKATKELDDLKAAKTSKKEQLVATTKQLESDRDALVSLKQDAQKSSDDLSKQLEDHKSELSKLQSELTVAMAASKAQADNAAKAKEAEKASSSASSDNVVAVNTGSSNSGSSSAVDTSYPSSSGVSVQSGNAGGSNASHQSASGVVGIAAQYIGVPYVWGGSTPAGFDCSGLVQYVFNQAGISLPRTTYGQINVGTPVSMSALQPGDLLFWGNYHVGIYAGGGRYIHAPAPGQNVTYGSMAYFTPDSARRV